MFLNLPLSRPSRDDYSFCSHVETGFYTDEALRVSCDLVETWTSGGLSLLSFGELWKNECELKDFLLGHLMPISISVSRRFDD